MYWRCLAVLITFSVGPAAAAEKVPWVFRFNRAQAGTVPDGWKIDKTGTGKGSAWKIVKDGTGPSKTGYVLAQTADSPGAMFNLCIADMPLFKDGEISVAFKAMEGK